MTPYLTLGPITIDVIELAVRGSTSPTPTVTAEALVGVTGSLPPISFTVDPCGIALQIDFVNGNAGPADIATVFLATDRPRPQRGGAADVGRGPDRGLPRDRRYEGALAIDIASVGIEAMTVIDTAVAGEPDGWTFFASLTARFPGIPLGFGFTLTGLGRARRPQPRRRRRGAGARPARRSRRRAPVPGRPGARRGDPVRPDRRVLPGRPRQHGHRPGDRDRLGRPTIITGQLGVLISLPQGVIMILGSLGAACRPRTRRCSSCGWTPSGSSTSPAGPSWSWPRSTTRGCSGSSS